MKLFIDIPQILARNITHPRTNDDEIYLAYFITLAKKGGSKKVGGGTSNQGDDGKASVRKHVVKRLSAVEEGVGKGHRWCPKDMWVELDVEDAELMYITMVLYEKDDGAIYKKLSKQTSTVKPEDFDWSCIELPVDFTNYMSWAKSIWKAVVGLFNYLRQDDMLGEHSLVINLKDEHKGWMGYRELKFKKFGGDYRVQLSIEDATHREYWG